ncbi:hypothetical protein [uncultured Roseibium sp.]|uniref:hypothetical protein n=1 Tax=uncultured Roseibium sp. TaxID=1936171 RepID=UPI0026210766|nr:hypothetical protein [uncultured Roseibium sp.]
MSVNRKLDRLMWAERMRNVLIAAVIGVPLAIAISLFMLSQSGVGHHSGEPISGVLLDHSIDQRDDGSSRTTLHVRLEDGSEVTVRSGNMDIVAIGEEVVLMKRNGTNGGDFYYMPQLESANE